MTILCGYQVAFLYMKKFLSAVWLSIAAPLSFAQAVDCTGQPSATLRVSGGQSTVERFNDPHSGLTEPLYPIVSPSTCLGWRGPGP
jgi:hypothetical protein